MGAVPWERWRWEAFGVQCSAAAAGPPCSAAPPPPTARRPTPPIPLRLHLQHKFHRVPVVDDGGKCVGIVTRTDIFWALTQADQEGEDESPVSGHGLAL